MPANADSSACSAGPLSTPGISPTSVQGGCIRLPAWLHDTWLCARSISDHCGPPALAAGPLRPAACVQGAMYMSDSIVIYLDFSQQCGTRS